MFLPAPSIRCTLTPLIGVSSSSGNLSPLRSSQTRPLRLLRRTTPALAVDVAWPPVTEIARVPETFVSLACTPPRVTVRSVPEKPQPSCAVKRTLYRPGARPSNA